MIKARFFRQAFIVDSISLLNRYYTSRSGFKYSLEAMYTKTIKDVMFRQINLRDVPYYYTYDTAAALRKQPVFNSSVDSRIANAYELTNMGKDYRYSITGQISNNFANGLSFLQLIPMVCQKMYQMVSVTQWSLTGSLTRH